MSIDESDIDNTILFDDLLSRITHQLISESDILDITVHPSVFRRLEAPMHRRLILSDDEFVVDDIEIIDCKSLDPREVEVTLRLDIDQNNNEEEIF